MWQAKMTMIVLVRSIAAGTADCEPSVGSGLSLHECGGGGPGWQRNSSGLEWNSTGLCLSAGNHPKPTTLLGLQKCDALSPGQKWTLETSETRHLQNPPSQLCATVSSSHGGSIDVWGCEAKANEQFRLDTSTGDLIAPGVAPNLCVKPCGVVPPPPPSPSPLSGPIPVTLRAPGRRWDGLGGLSAGASSRLLLDYREPQRSQILDLLFKKKTGGTWQILKTEIGGEVSCSILRIHLALSLLVYMDHRFDCIGLSAICKTTSSVMVPVHVGDGQSSYGSETAVMHTKTDVDYNRGYETWLLKQAKARNPTIPTYCLSWTTPYWVGSYLTPAGVDYHLKYMQGVREHGE